MNKHTFFLFLAIIITSCSNAQGNSDIPLPSGKSYLYPKELQGMDYRIRQVSGVITVWHTPRTSSSSGRRASAMTQQPTTAGGAFHEGEPAQSEGKAGKFLHLFLPHATVCQARFEM